MNDDIQRELVAQPGTWVSGPDGAEWRLTIEHDQDTSINEFECYGRTQWQRNSIDTGFSVRPSDFGPHARIVTRDRGHCLWWEPLPEIWGTTKPYVNGTFDDDFAQAKRLIEDGFCIAHLVRRTTCDCCHQHIEQHATLGGIDVSPYDDESYWHSIVSDLADEIG